MREAFGTEGLRPRIALAATGPLVLWPRADDVLRIEIRRATIKGMGSDTKSANLMVRLDPASRRLLMRVAALRGVTASDYVRNVLVLGARRELLELERSTIVPDPADQLAFWRALNEPVKLTPAQRRLGGLMRGLK